MIGKFRHFNWLMFLSMLALIALGTVAIWSAGNARKELVFHGMWAGNLITAIGGLGLYFFFAAIDYRKFFSTFAIAGYVVSLVLLTAVLIFGDTVYGGRRWLWFFQPSEFSKLAILILIAWLFGSAKSPVNRFRQRFRAFVLSLAIIGLPAVLILAEPDLGTTLTLVPAALMMLFFARVWRKGLLTLVALATLAALMVLGAVYEAEKPGTPAARRERILKLVPLKSHQLKRVHVFLFPEEDLTGAGYNLHQAKISIGSGGFTGKGIGKSETNHLKYLPQAISMNDFIFCVYAEETGFVGSLLLLTLFAGLLLAGLWAAYVCREGSGRLFALGFLTLVFAHVFVNIAMAIGLVPITGLPLPFISSGRTFLVTVMVGFGLIQSASMHGRDNQVS